MTEGNQRAKEGAWPVVPLSELAADERNSITDGPFGSKLKTEHYTDDGPRVIRLKNIGDGEFVDAKAHISEAHFSTLQKHRVFPGDIVIAALGENPPRSCLVPESLGPAIVKADCIRFKAGPRVLPRFLNYVLNGPRLRQQAKGIIHGVGRPRLNLGEIKALPIPVPPVSEQRQIVAEIEKQFTRLEAGVTALRRMQANLKRYRAAVLKAACDGKLVEGDRTHWQTMRLGQLVTIRYGKMLPTKEFSESGFPVFGANGIIGFHTRYLYEAEQVLISCRGAYSGKLNLSPPKCYITNNSLVLEMPERSRVEKRFLFYVLQAADKSKLVTGSAQPQVTINNADVLDVPVPPLDEQTRIVAEVERRLSVVEEMEGVVFANLQRATRLRQSVLHAAFSCNSKPARI